MHLILILFTFLCADYSHAADTTGKSSSSVLLRLHYKYLYIQDTTGGNRRAMRDRMALDILKDSALFYPEEMIEKALLAKANKDKIDAVYATGVVNGADLAPYYYSGHEIWLTKNTATADLSFSYSSVRSFRYHEKGMVQQWEAVADSFKTILGNPCYLARTEFRGRIWEAWYTFDIPATTGPWKFHGLPGAIVKVKDQRNHFLYELTGVEVNPPKLFDVALVDSQPIQFREVTAREMQDFFKLSYENPRQFNQTVMGVFVHDPDPVKRAPRYYNPQEQF